MLERREWLREHHDDLRTAIMLEPRGHADMYGALLTPHERKPAALHARKINRRAPRLVYAALNFRHL